MRVKMAVVVLLAGAVVLPASAAATPPVREPVPADALTSPAGLYCDFPIQVTPLNLGEKLTFFSDGRIRVTAARSSKSRTLTTAIRPS